MKIKGRVINGLGIATWTIAKQKPFFIEKIPQFSNYKNGTINLELFDNLNEPVKFDQYFKDILWDDTGKYPIEDFGFIVIKSLTVNNQTFKDWGYIYFPMGSPHKGNRKQLELVGNEIVDLNRNDLIEIEIEDNYIFFYKNEDRN